MEKEAFSSQFHKKFRGCSEGCCFWVSTVRPSAEDSAHGGMNPCLSRTHILGVSSEKSIPSSRGHCTSWCIFNPKQLRGDVIPLITVPGELRSQSHSSWHFTPCSPLCLCSQLAAGNKFGHKQDKFLQRCAWFVQKLPHTYAGTSFLASENPEILQQPLWERQPCLCKVSFALGTPEMGLQLPRAPASLGK